ncbi:(d)CMP kinase [Mechercharimyces sp. CAU 1602]|uniref:(d)CMP kinase n=1 Tax=Mechercharimyces sp. CAU 1602 TaxID=2973933 RepID=UPI0021618E38|nr:(d)CMP kinase [Mechercharimyces sp. CAU 1602]MCS1350962.1 (d)CMP kinase [Mechercharimyces sp. CAU 1602]
MKRLIVAIDGPAGAGKSTVARLVAQELGLTYIDTGAMYRAVAWKSLQLEQLTEDRVARMMQETRITLESTESGSLVYVDEVDVTSQIRTSEVTAHASFVAKIPQVRQALIEMQRQMANSGVVMDGRDIGTHVFPNAEVKVFLTASIEERARRRYDEMKEKGLPVDYEKLKEEIGARDHADQNRTHAPLRPAADAHHVDTTGLSISNVVEEILQLCRTKLGAGE